MIGKERCRPRILGSALHPLYEWHIGKLIIDCVVPSVFLFISFVAVLFVFFLPAAHLGLQMYIWRLSFHSALHPPR